MNDYTASNGIKVSLDIMGGVQYDTSALFIAMPGSYTNAAREFFRAERDEELGRWRWPENPDYVVYAAPREGMQAMPDDEPFDLFIINEAWGASLSYQHAESAAYDEPDMPFVAAAHAYFAAHPQKPWHSAKPGEIWLLTVDKFNSRKNAFYVSLRGEPMKLDLQPVFVTTAPSNPITYLGIQEPAIVAGHRIYSPEDES